MAPRPVVVSQDAHLPVSVEVLWELLGNTEHINRMLALPAVTYAPAEEGLDGLYRPASARMLGIPMRWREYPFDWIQFQRYAVLRVYDSGPLERFWAGIELSPEPDGCRLRSFAELIPRRGWPFARIPVRIIARKNVQQLLAYCQKFVAMQQERSEQPFPRRRASGVSATPLERLRTRVLAEWPANPDVVARLCTLIAEGSDEEVLHMRPFGLARRWGVPRTTVLATFLYATVVGLLELDWELMCPNCRIPKAGFRSFGGVTEQFHCDLCGTEYASDLDRTTELRFSVHPSVRAAEDAIYCIGGPVNTPHILVQQGLRARETVELEATLPNEVLRVRLLRLNRIVRLLPAEDGESELHLRLAADNWIAEELRFRPGAVRLKWMNAGDSAHTVVVEKEEWDPDAVTAARVMALPEFRSLFSAEVLQPGRQIGIRNLCVVFTDLKDSTALYERVGDAPAYGRVHRHFDFLIDCFTRHEGGIVKTIGDAVMASFPSPEQALHAALEVQSRIDAYNAEQALAEPIIIKIGLHHGAAIAVNANGQMDYFGRTVNIAARVQGLSEGGDIVLSDVLWNDPTIQAVLREAPFRAEPLQATLKGIAGEAALYRLRPTADAARAASAAVAAPAAEPQPEAHPEPQAERPAQPAAAPEAKADAPTGAVPPRIFRY